MAAAASETASRQPSRWLHGLSSWRGGKSGPAERNCFPSGVQGARAPRHDRGHGPGNGRLAGANRSERSGSSSAAGASAGRDASALRRWVCGSRRWRATGGLAWKLGGGQRKMVGVVKTLVVADPRLWVLDEPSAAL